MFSPETFPLGILRLMVYVLTHQHMVLYSGDGEIE